MADKYGEPTISPSGPQGPHGRRQTIKASFLNAYSGLSYCLCTQRNLRIHLAITALVLVASAVLQVSLTELAVLVFCIAVVIVAEMLNTALECVVDLVTSDHHPLAKLSKDISAGAVLVASLGAAAVGAFIFLPKILQLFVESMGEIVLYSAQVNPVG